MFTPQYSCMDEEQQTPNPVESKDKSGTDPEELAYQKMYEKYLKQKKRYEYYLKNKRRLDELKNKLETASIDLFNKQYYEDTKSQWTITKDYGMLKLTNIEKTLKSDDKWDYFIWSDDVWFHLRWEFWKDHVLEDIYSIKDYENGIIPKVNGWHLYSCFRINPSWASDYVRYYFYWTISLPKKPILPKKPVKKEIQPEIETLKTQVQLATLSQNIKPKEFLIWWETVDKKVYDLYNQFKRDRMIKQYEIWELGPKTVTQKYQNLSREYFKTYILNKDAQYTVR